MPDIVSLPHIKKTIKLTQPVLVLGIVFFAYLLLLSGCARLPIRENIPASPQVILAALESQRGDFQHFTATGIMYFHSEYGSISLQCRWEIRLPDTVMIRVYGPLGFRLGDLLVEGDHVEFFNYMLDQQESTTIDSMMANFPGMSAVSSSQDLYPFPFIRRNDIANLDTAQFRLNSDEVIFSETGRMRRLQLDSKYLVVIRESYTSELREDVIVKEYYNYKKTKRSWLPTKIRFVNEQSSQWMELSFNSISIR